MHLTDKAPGAGNAEGSDISSRGQLDAIRDTQAQNQKQVASLHPRWRGGKAGYVYDVTYAGEQVVTGSADPEHDLARALLAKGVTGLVEIVDGESGKPRTFVNVAPAAKCSTFEEQRQLGRGRWKPFRA